MRVLIRYRLKPDRVAVNLDLLRDAYDEMNALRPPGLRHATYQLDDEVSFIDFVETQGRGPGPLPSLPAFGRFRAGLDDRCVEPPTMFELRHVASYDPNPAEFAEIPKGDQP